MCVLGIEPRSTASALNCRDNTPAYGSMALNYQVSKLQGVPGPDVKVIVQVMRHETLKSGENMTASLPHRLWLVCRRAEARLGLGGSG